MTASGLPIDGESLLRFKKHHAPVAFEAAHHTAAVVLDTLSFRLACFHGFRARVEQLGSRLRVRAL